MSTPYAKLLEVLETYYHPEAWEGAFNQLRALASANDPALVQFKQELRHALRNPHMIPEQAIRNAAEYDDGSAWIFLARLWDDLYYPENPLTEG